MAIAFRASSSTVASGTVTKPTGVVSGDVLVAHLYIPGGSATITAAPAGWTPLDSQTATNASYQMATYWYVAGAAEPANYTWALSAGNPDLVVMAFSGCDPIVPIHQHAIQANSASANTTTPSIVTTRVTALLACLSAFGGGSYTLHAGWGGVVNNGDVLGAEYQLNLAAGTISATVFSGPASGVTIGAVVALVPPLVTPPRPAIVSQAAQRAATR